MSGTYEGGRKAAATNKERQGHDFYRRIGRRGGSRTAADGVIKGFALKTPCDCDHLKFEHHKAQCAGSRGGVISKRGKAAYAA